MRFHFVLKSADLFRIRKEEVQSENQRAAHPVC